MIRAWLLSLLVILAVPVWAREGPPLTRTDLHFAKADEGALYDRLQAQIDSHLGKREWKVMPLRLGGSFVGRWWAQGPRTAEIRALNQAFMNAPGSASYRLETMTYKLPEVFGIVFSAHRNPPVNGWGVSFSFSQGGQRIVSAGAGLSLRRYLGGKVTLEFPVLDYRLHLSEDYAADHPETFRVRGRSDQIAGLARDAKSFQEQTLKAYAQLYAGACAEIQAGRVQFKTYGRYEGNGIPPPVILKPISEAQRAELLGRLQAEYQAIRAALEQDGPAIYQVWMGLVDVRSVWN